MGLSVSTIEVMCDFVCKQNHSDLHNNTLKKAHYLEFRNSLMSKAINMLLSLNPAFKIRTALNKEKERYKKKYLPIHLALIMNEEEIIEIILSKMKEIEEYDLILLIRI